MKSQFYKFAIMDKGKVCDWFWICAESLKSAKARMGAYLILYGFAGYNYRCVKKNNNQTIGE